jgi:predicted phosphodiesterase
MKLGILSDIHGNYVALETVLNDGNTKGVTSWVSLGDNIGYLPWTFQVLNMLDAHNIDWVLGNHEICVASALNGKDFYESHSIVQQTAHYIARNMPEQHCSKLRRKIELNSYTLNFEILGLSRDFAAELPDYSVLFTHSNPVWPKNFGIFINSWDDAEYDIFSNSRSPHISFVGHSHNPAIFTTHSLQSSQFATSHIRRNVSMEHKMCVVVPSVGIPRKSNPQTGYCIYDFAENCIEIHRIDYDINRVCHELELISDYPRVGELQTWLRNGE